VTAYTQTCPQGAPGGGPFTASSWSALHGGTITFGSSGPQSFTSLGGNPAIAAEFDPIGGTTDACKTVKAETELNTANYTMTSNGFTLLGLPTVKATIKTLGLLPGEIAARLWDVLPSGEQRLISRSVYRLTENQTGTITFQLHGNGYEFAKGDTVKLQLLGRDAPYYRASNGFFTIEATNVTVSLPTTLSGEPGESCHEGDGEGQVGDSQSQTGAASFKFDADPCDDGAPESVSEQDPGRGTDFHSTQVQSVAFDDVAHSVTVTGLGTNKGLPVTFVMVAVDSSLVPGGLYSLVLSDGYSRSGTLTSGNVLLH